MGKKGRLKISVKNLYRNSTFCSEIVIKTKDIPIKSTKELIQVLVVEMPTYRSEWHT